MKTLRGPQRQYPQVLINDLMRGLLAVRQQRQPGTVRPSVVQRIAAAPRPRRRVRTATLPMRRYFPIDQAERAVMFVFRSATTSVDFYYSIPCNDCSETGGRSFLFSMKSSLCRVPTVAPSKRPTVAAGNPTVNPVFRGAVCHGRVAATPRRQRGYSVETSRGDAAAATWIFRGDESR